MTMSSVPIEDATNEPDESTENQDKTEWLLSPTRNSTRGSNAGSLKDTKDLDEDIPELVVKLSDEKPKSLSEKKLTKTEPYNAENISSTGYSFAPVGSSNEYSHRYHHNGSSETRHKPHYSRPPTDGQWSMNYKEGMQDDPLLPTFKQYPGGQGSGPNGACLPIPGPYRGRTDSSGQRSDGRGSFSSGLSCPASRSLSSKASTPLKRLSHTLSSQNISTRSEGPVCRICHEGDVREVLISPCYCSGSVGLLHVSCLQTWLGSSNKTSCEICGFHFALRRKPMSFKMFLRDPGSGKDKSHLICDSFSFLIITPLIVITTYMCFAGALKYYSPGSWERGGLTGLALSLIILYSVWLMIILRHNWKLWRQWRMFHQEVTLLCTPDQRNYKAINVDQMSFTSGSHSTVGSIQLQSIKISVAGSMKQFKAGHRLINQQGPTARHANGGNLAKMTKGTNKQGGPDEQNHRYNFPERTKYLQSGSKAERSNFRQPVFYSPKSAIPDKIQENTERSQKGFFRAMAPKSMCNEMGKLKSNSGSVDTCYLENQSRINTFSDNFQYPERNKFKKHKRAYANKTYSDGYYSHGRNDLQEKYAHYHRSVSKNVMEDSLPLTSAAAIFSRGNSPADGSTTVSSKPETSPSLDYTKEWVNESPSVGCATSSVGVTPSVVGVASPPNSRDSCHTIGQCSA